MNSTPVSSPVKDPYKATPSMEDQYKKTPVVGTGLKAAREKLPRKVKGTPLNGSHQNDKAEEGIQGE